MNRSLQRGQALLWFLATTATCCAVLALVYNVGQVTNEKEKTINAADASALSGALVEARILNFEAYTNRAMIANEVTIAQFASMDSFIRYAQTLSQNIATYTSWVPYLNDVTQTIADGVQAAQDVFDPVAYGTITGVNGVIEALKVAREAANLVGAVAANEVAGQVAGANKTVFNGRFDTAPEVNGTVNAAFLVVNEVTWMNFTSSYDGNDRGNAAQVILNSRDQFTKARGLGLVLDAINIAMELNTLGLSGIEKTSGSTTLVDYDHWAAQDSLDSWVLTPQFCLGVIPCGFTRTYLPVPLGYGRTDVDSDGSVGRDLCNPSGGAPNCTLAVNNANVIQPPGWQGIPNIRDLANPGGANNADPSLTYVSAVQKSADATLTTQRIGGGMNNVHINGPQGSPDLTDNLQNSDRLTSIAAARVFYARPDWNTRDITEGNLPRPDRKHEYASLYNPYWQARLTPPDPAMTTLLYAAIGKPGLNLVMP